MTPSALIDEIARRGARAELRDDGKVSIAPASVLDAELLDTLRAHRDEIAAELARRREIALRAARLLRARQWPPTAPVCSFFVGPAGAERCERCTAGWLEHVQGSSPS